MDTTSQVPLTPIAMYLTLEDLSYPSIIDKTVTHTGINNYMSYISCLPTKFLLDIDLLQ